VEAAEAELVRREVGYEMAIIKVGGSATSACTPVCSLAIRRSGNRRALAYVSPDTLGEVEGGERKACTAKEPEGERGVDGGVIVGERLRGRPRSNKVSLASNYTLVSHSKLENTCTRLRTTNFHHLTNSTLDHDTDAFLDVSDLHSTGVQHESVLQRSPEADPAGQSNCLSRILTG